MTGTKPYQPRDVVLYHVGKGYNPFVGVVLMTPAYENYMWVKFWNITSHKYEVIKMEFDTTCMWNIGRLPDFVVPDNRWATDSLPA